MKGFEFKKSYGIQLAIGIAVLVLLLYEIDFSNVYETMLRTNFYYIVLAGISYLALNFLLSFRLRHLLKAFGLKLNFKDVFQSHMGGMLFSDVTPGKAGYLATPYFLKKKSGARMTTGMSTILSAQGIDFISKVCMCLVGVFYLTLVIGVLYNESPFILAGAGVIFLIGLAILIFIWVDEPYTRKILGKIPFINKFEKHLPGLKAESSKLKKHIPFIVLIYFIGWFLAALQWFFIGQALGLELPFLFYLFLHPLLTAIMFIPITPAGLGIAEGSGVGLLGLLGVSSGLGISFMLLARAVNIIIDLIGTSAILEK